MRISDWSSDVCSSDRAAAMRAGRRRNFGGGGNGGSAEDGGGTCDRSYRVAVLLIFVCPLAAARYSTSTCASPTVISTDLCRPSRRMVPDWPAPSHVITHDDVAVTV